MTALQDRARAFENQFAHQQELLFKAEARRNVLIGRWAAATMKRDDAETYARDLAAGEINQPRHLLERLRRDFAAAGVTVQDREIEARMSELMDKATAEVQAAA